MKKRSKKKAVDNHFALRCLERLGYIPNKNQLVEDIQKGRLAFYGRESNRITRWIWKDPINNVKCIIPYDKERKQVITVLLMKEIEEVKDGKEE